MGVITVLNYKKLWNKQGFTLIELLFSLLIFSMILHSMSSIYQTYGTVSDSIHKDNSGNFLHFLTLLEMEVNQFEFDGIENNRILLRDSENEQFTYTIQWMNQKIVKTPGHQIILFDVKDWLVTAKDGHIQIGLTFKNNQLYTGTIMIESSKRVINETE